MTVGDRIRNRRLELGLTQGDLAEIMGYTSKSCVCKVETGGDNVTTTKISKFAAALNTTPGYLMGWEEQLEQIDTDQLVDFMLSEDDREMYSDFCKLSDTDKQLIRNMIKALANKGEVQ